MRLSQLSASLLLQLVLVGFWCSCSCSSSFIYPDEFEEIKRTGHRRGQRPSLQIIDEHGPVSQGPLRSASVPLGNISSSSSSSSNDARPSRPTGTLFDDFLPAKWRDHVLNLISRGITKFTLDMDRAIERASSKQQVGENLVFSPVSLTVTLAMILLASSGQTFQEVAKILGLESGVDITHHSEIVHQMFGLLLQESDKGHLLNTAAPQCKFAFGIFVEAGFPVRDQFKAVSEKIYNSEIVNVDFLRRSRETQVMINDWVKNKTMGKIQSILSDAPSPSTEVIILSALYFNGEWNQHFMKGGTKRKPFTVSENEVMDVDMMYNGGDFPYYEDKDLDLKIIGLPYKGLEVTMYAILPVSNMTTLEQVKGRLSPEVLDKLVENTSTKPCVIGYPKMKLSNSLRLQSALQSLGLNSLFDPASADLSVLSQGRAHQSHPRAKRQSRPIDREFVQFLASAPLPKFGVDELRNSAGLRNPRLFADEVVHKVEMTVDEKGTEAAAATAVILNRSIDSKRFIADRPFLFFIRHNPTKTIWFWASIKKPSYAVHDNA